MAGPPARGQRKACDMTFTTDFTYETRPVRVVFRPGAAVTATPDEAVRLGLRRLLVVCGSRGEPTAQQVAGALGDACAGVMISSSASE